MINNKLKLGKMQSKTVVIASIALVCLAIVLIKLPTTTYNHFQSSDESPQYVENEIVIQATFEGVTISSINDMCGYWTQRCANASVSSAWDIIPSVMYYPGPDGGWIDPISYLRCAYNLDRAITEMTMDITDPIIGGIQEGGGTITTTENQRAYERGRRFEESINQGILDLRQKLLDVK